MRAFDKLAVSMLFRRVLLLCVALFAVTLPIVGARPRHHAAPTIRQISPASYEFGIPHAASGSYETQVTLTIQGSGFRNGAKVTFNGRAVPTVFASKTQIAATVPGDWVREVPNKLVVPNIPADGMVGDAKIRVRNPGHGGASRAFLFRVTATPID
jgi:hypothetical protein